MTGPKRATLISDATAPVPWTLRDAAGAEVATGAAIPLVLGAVWYTTRRIHKKLRARE